MKSPFDDLQIDKSLVCEFFASFARFEYAMKEADYCGRDRYGNASPDWRKLRERLGPGLKFTNEAASKLVDYMIAEPPQVQRYVDGSPRFEVVPLTGECLGELALEGAKRVRNNLFHGGKHTPHSPPERDTKLIRASLAVLEACLQADGHLNAVFELQVI